MIRRNESPDDLLSSAEAALIIGKNSGRTISPDYMGQLIRQGRIKPHKLDARTNLFRRGDVEKIIVGKHRGRRPDSVRMKEKERMQDDDKVA